jgi:hypothetical protein
LSRRSYCDAPGASGSDNQPVKKHNSNNDTISEKAGG